MEIRVALSARKNANDSRGRVCEVYSATWRPGVSGPRAHTLLEVESSPGPLRIDAIADENIGLWMVPYKLNPGRISEHSREGD